MMNEILEKLQEIVNNFCICTGVPVTIYKNSGEILASYRTELKFCSIFSEHQGQLNKKCTDSMNFSAQIARSLGEPYIFACPSDLINIAIPVLIDKKHQASVIVGPLVMGNLNDTLVDRVFNLYPEAQTLLPKISLAISKLMIYNPNHIQSLSTLLFNSILGFCRNWQDYEHLNTRHQSQLYIGDQIEKYKHKNTFGPEDNSTLNSLERKLICYIEERDQEKSTKILRAYYDEIFIIEGGNYDNIKGRIFELFGTLSQKAIDNGASVQKIFSSDFNHIFAMSQIQTTSELFSWINNIVAHFIDHVYSTLVLGQSDLIKAALLYIGDAYSEKITLNDLARHLHISSNYISQLFKREVGVNFTGYLNNIRIQKSLTYLEHEDLSIADIAVQVGFGDQSYYTKVFKKLLGETPKQYRKRLTAQE
ncbi:MAG: PocR ligand-binding domain-containing protein [Eubacterium aggregans]|uniref:helix-turn-helix domain-containing protein n=1 Tax=Eubacterium aggregans TaxID=81409 RepID=UPI002B1F45EF|nr:helix-turn-helix domain-containing protein [Eubacterium aggregans]MEA5074515.1 PocR ligand-binding domain-containing protein [Eubacterium aggregans]